MKELLERFKNKQVLQSIIDLVMDDLNDDTVVYPDLQVAFVGVVMRMGQPDIVCYDYDKVIEKYMQDGMTKDEAREYFDFNTVGAWHGETTPCFLRKEI